MNIKGLDFKCTCSACPEQYDVFDNNKNIVGYVRLRWGGLSCKYPDVGGEGIYYASVGDGLNGCFKNDSQRRMYLTKIADEIIKKIGKENIKMRFLRHGELQDNEIVKALREAVDDYEDGAISEVRDLLVEIVNAIDEWSYEYNI